MRRGYLSYLALAIASVLIVSCAPPQGAAEAPLSSELFPVEVNDKWGYIDAVGKIVIQPQFDFAEEFHDGVALVVPKWGDNMDDTPPSTYIDRSGKILFTPRELDSTYEYHFSEGLCASASKDGKYGFIDKAGNLVVKPQFLCGEPAEGECGCANERGPGRNFSEGFARVEIHGRHFFIDKTGKNLFGKTFDGADSFSNGLAPVVIGGKWGYIDKTGRLAIPATYERAEQFSDGVAAVTLPGDDGKCIFIDRQGNQAVPGEFEWAGQFSAGLAMTSRGLIDKQGNITSLPKTFESHSKFSEGLLRGRSVSGYGSQTIFIDRTGKIVIRLRPDFICEDAEDFRGGLARVWDQEKKTAGYIDKMGRRVWMDK
jgi:hypothetical protein